MQPFLQQNKTNVIFDWDSKALFNPLFYYIFASKNKQICD